MYEPTLKHELDPPATGFFEPMFFDGRNYCFKRGIVECSLNIQKGTQRNLYVLSTFPVFEQPGRELSPWTYLPYRHTGTGEVVFEPGHLA